MSAPHKNTALPQAGTLDHIQEWVFDLDNTLYPGTSSLFPQIDERMKQFIANFLNIPQEDAFRIQKQFYRDYGTTMRGLMLNHGMEPDLYLDYVHDIDHSVLDVDHALIDLLAALPGRRLVFTNGSEKHAERVLDTLGMSHLFEGIFDIKAADYLPKPEEETYQRMIARHGVNPRVAAFFEDSHLNLGPAAAIGMTTVLVRCGPDHAPLALTPETDLSHCHHITDNLTDWLTSAVTSLKQG